MRSALALVLGLATVGSLALNARPHRGQLARPRVRLSRAGLAGVVMQNEEEIAELEARLAGLKKVKVRRKPPREPSRPAECCPEPSEPPRALSRPEP
eukprot:scaffold125422_cov57-Phaeocystis_antarctica.AAC.1